jgi:alkanesulfonate monooxygenase SsuD/methylene tetrahydromethanopterin reductase-like flavin-dependent oxidoreductase (luciferase family)
MADLGLHGFPTGDDGADWIADAHRVLDELPPVFSTVWLSDHFQFDGDPEPDVWTQLTWLGATFPAVRLGTMVLSQSYRNPGLLGIMAATLQDLSKGRLILGLGAGWHEEEYRALHYDYPSGGTRVAQLAETIELLKTLWTTSPASYQGEWYGITDAVCPKLETPIPILVGTHGKKAIQVVARLADWWAWDGPWESTYREPFERLRAECEAIGRPFESIVKTAELTISMPDDPSTFEAWYANEEAYPGQRFGIVGPTAADVIREIETLVDVGVSHLPLNFQTEREYRRFLDEVVPRVRLTPVAGPA